MLFVIVSCASVGHGRGMLSVHALQCEFKTNPIGIETRRPHLSWKIESKQRNQMQSSYRIWVADSPEKLDRGGVKCWDSKIVTTDQSIQIEYAGQPFKPDKKYYWKVKVWSRSGEESDWSETASWHTGLFNESGWNHAKWIGIEQLPDSLKVVPGIHLSGDSLGNKGLRRPVVPQFRKEFNVKKSITLATLFICGLGHYEASMNGIKIGNSFLSPGWTHYDKTCLYNSVDVTDRLKIGNNTIGVIVGNGFYNINRERYRKLVIAFGMPKMICKLIIHYADGSEETVISNSDWKCSPSPVTYTSIYGGEDYDARLEQQGWNISGFDDSQWTNALPVEAPRGKLTAETDFPLEVMEVIQAKRVQNEGPIGMLVDFGQNASGIIEIKLKGKKGQSVKLVPGELITAERKINQKASGEPYYFSYTLKGDSVESWKPRFTYYGFRYVMVEGAVPDTSKPTTDVPRIIDLKFLHTRNSSPQTGEFTCSSRFFNQLFDLIRWAIRSNLQSVVTDCPHREKLGWLEQTYLMGCSLFYNYELYPLYKKLVWDMMDAQTSSGLVPDIAPEYVRFEGGFRDSPEWGSAAVIVPWMITQWTGDQEVLERAWPMMERYVEYLGTKADHHILSHGLGDWYDLGRRFPGPAQLTPKELTATAIYFYDIKVLAETAELLGFQTEAKKMHLLSEEVKKAFNGAFFNESSKTYSTGSQTAMSMPLSLGLVEERFRKNVFQNLVDSINASGKALTAGDIGFHFLVKALEDNGASSLVYDMNFRDDVPGYGFQLAKGATALTESWAALEEVSNNHLMLGHIMEWFYAGLAGIQQDKKSTGFKKLIIQPEITGDINEVNARYESPYGSIKSEWNKQGDTFALSVDIPVNTTATVYLPTNKTGTVQESGEKIEKVRDIVFLRTENNKLLYQIGSGSYSFKMRL